MKECISDITSTEIVSSAMLAPWSFGGQRIELLSHKSTTEKSSETVSVHQEIQAEGVEEKSSSS